MMDVRRMDADAKEVLEGVRARAAPTLPADLVRAVYEIEERVQFREERPDAVEAIARRVQAALEREDLQEDSDSDASR